MCQAKAYLDEQPIMEEVIWLEPTQEGFRLHTLFGETREVKATLQGVDLLKHRIMLTSTEGKSPQGITEGD
jgi:predicted RNA-binding protein